MHRDEGFSLIEVTIAVIVMSLVAAGVGALAVAAVKGAHRARLDTIALFAATERMEQLRALAYTYGDATAPAALSDMTTDLSATPAGSGGQGLSTSPAGSVRVVTIGYVDYLNRDGQWIGTGTTIPPDCLLVRQWEIGTDPSFPDLMVFQVRVSSARPFSPNPGGRDVQLVTLRWRYAS